MNEKKLLAKISKLEKKLETLKCKLPGGDNMLKNERDLKAASILVNIAARREQFGRNAKDALSETQRIDNELKKVDDVICATDEADGEKLVSLQRQRDSLASNRTRFIFYNEHWMNIHELTDNIYSLLYAFKQMGLNDELFDYLLEGERIIDNISSVDDSVLAAMNAFYNKIFEVNQRSNIGVSDIQENVEIMRDHISTSRTVGGEYNAARIKHEAELRRQQIKSGVGQTADNTGKKDAGTNIN